MGFVKSLIWILIISLILSGCDDREEYELVLDNPFDPDNPQTSGDPFQLSVQTGGRKSILKWNVPEIDFEKYIIYRQEDDASLIQLSVIPKTSTQYVDDTIEGGHSYIYRISAARSVGTNEEERSAMSPVKNTTQIYLNALPTVKIESLQTTNNSVAVTWTGIDNDGTVAGYTYRLDNGEWASFTATTKHDFPDLTPGKHVLEIKAKDDAGEIGPTTTQTFKLILQPSNIIWDKDGAEMALIPKGRFEMGDITWNASQPVHPVELDTFYMDIHEVTVGQFKQFVEESGYDYNAFRDKSLPPDEGDQVWQDEIVKLSPTDEHPIVQVNWDDATAYAKWAGKRLPTEAEWEYAARGGLVGKRYPWGNEITHDNANYEGTGGKDQWSNTTAPVGSFKPNGYGLFDMSGNAYEWCADWHNSTYYSNSPLRNPTGAHRGDIVPPRSGDSSENRVVRGGSFGSNAIFLSVAIRRGGYGGWGFLYGFRCVIDVDASGKPKLLPAGKRWNAN